MTVTGHSRNGNIHLFMLKNRLGWNLGYSNLRIHLYQLLFCDKLPKKKKKLKVSSRGKGLSLQFERIQFIMGKQSQTQEQEVAATSRLHPDAESDECRCVRGSHPS